MSLLSHSKSRAAASRTNGAKSTGPSTPAGLIKARLASVKHGLFATEETLKASIDPQEFAKLFESFLTVWQPEDDYIAARVQQLASLHFIVNRLMLVRAHELTVRCHLSGNVALFELEASEPGALLGRLENRIRRYQADISRLERDIMRLKKFHASVGPSQESLETNDEPETAPEAQRTPQIEQTPTTTKQPEYPPISADIQPVM